MSLRKHHGTDCKAFQAAFGSFGFILGPARRIQGFYVLEVILIKVFFRKFKSGFSVEGGLVVVQI